MNTVTIPKKMALRDDLIVIPRREYERLLRFADKKRYTDLDRDLDKSIAEYKAGKFFGPFDAARVGVAFLKSRKISRKNQ